MSAMHRSHGDKECAAPAISAGSAGKENLILVGMLEAARESLPHDTAGASRFIEAALDLIRNSRVEIALADSLVSTQRFRRVAEYVETNLAQSLRIDELAAVAGISFADLNELFRRLTGDALRAYLRGRRLKRATCLMRSTPLKLVHIAAQCGFADQAHFSRTFRVQYGLSPRAWREALSTTQGAAASVHGHPVLRRPSTDGKSR